MPLDDARRAAKRGKADDDMAWMEAVRRGPLGNSATHVEWRSQMHAIKGWSWPTFKRRLKDFKQRHPELTGARWRGDLYSLSSQPTAAMVELVASLRPGLTSDLAYRAAARARPGSGSGSAGLRDLPSGEDLIAAAKAYVKPARVE
jgi:hypothetical protein